MVRVESLTDGSELLREIPVVVKLALGSEHLSLVLTSTSIIVAHGGKRGAGAVVGSTFVGRLSGALEDLFKTRKDSGTDKAIKSQDPKRILEADKDNFKIDYGDIVHVEIDGISPTVTAITILTKDEKFEFLSRKEYESVVKLLENQLGSKVRTRRL
jgi:hypothetical protein